MGEERGNLFFQHLRRQSTSTLQHDAAHVEQMIKIIRFLDINRNSLYIKEVS